MVKIHFTWGWAPEEYVALLGAGFSKEAVVDEDQYAVFIGFIFGVVSITWETPCFTTKS